MNLIKTVANYKISINDGIISIIDTDLGSNTYIQIFTKAFNPTQPFELFVRGMRASYLFMDKKCYKHLLKYNKKEHIDVTLRDINNNHNKIYFIGDDID